MWSDLETLLLFQALRADGVTPTSFNRISDQLKSIPLIRNDPKYDSGRLSPDALRELYLGLLKEEAKEDLERQTNGETNLSNGDASPASRKRKAPSPPLPTVREAAQHAHLIPQLVTRLYTRYREGIISKLRACERKYADIKEEIGEIEAGQRDDHLQRKRAASQTQSPRPSPKPSSSAHTQPSLVSNDDVPPTAAPATTASPAPAPSSLQRAAVEAAKPPSRPPSQSKIEDLINHEPKPQDGPGHRRASSNTTLPPLSEMAPKSPHFGIPPNVAPSVPHIQPMPHAPTHGYTQSPPGGHQSPYAPSHAHPRPTSVSSPQVQQSISRPSSSPRPILPPPRGMQFPPPTPGSHTGSPVSHMPPLAPQPYQQPYQPPYQPQSQAQHRLASGPSPTNDASPRVYPGTPIAPQPSGYYQQQQPVDRRTSYPQHGQPPTYPNHQPQQPGGYMLLPFQVQPQDPSKPVPIQQQPLRPPQGRPQPQVPYIQNAPATAPRPHPPSRLVSEIVTALATPPRPRIKPLWKSEYRPSPYMVPSPVPPRPEIEPLSPTFKRAKSPIRETRSTRGRVLEEPMRAEPASKTRTSKRRANARDKSPHSVVSSVADDSLRTRTRSHSVSTAAGANPPSDDRPGSRNGVKAEPSTPADMMDEAEPAPAIAATPVPGMMTRKRRGTIQSLPVPPPKRKRQESPAEENEALPTPPPRSNTVVATRNFAKMSSAIMNDITSHKHASYFAREVREKDAPGYGDIVRQPQNLRAIRNAITAGTKAITAATATVDSASNALATTSTTVELERTVDVMPPKAIVNGAQLEKELMRMFANAYLFNPGEDGMALSTKEMSEDVEQKINEWRGTEQGDG